MSDCSDGFHAPGETYWPVTDTMREKIARAKMVALRCSSLAAKTPIAGEPDPDWWERQSALGDACDKIHELLALIEPVMEENERYRELLSCAVGFVPDDAEGPRHLRDQIRAALSPKSENSDE
jgi:hypothetical protein